ncbi:MAG: hypothetical protein WA441_05130 [Methyloceanibacter sp.]
MAKESSNGLTAADEALLRERLAEVERIHLKPNYFAGQERDKISAVYRKLKGRLDPHNPQQLNNEAFAIVELYGNTLDEAVLSMEKTFRDAVDEVVPQ